MVADQEQKDDRVGRFALDLLKQKLGRLEAYPQSAVERAVQVYRPFLIAYLDIVQLQDLPTIDEQAPDFRIDKVVVDEMRHFFSDYQHLTREYIRMDNLIARLARTNRELEPHLFQQIVDDIHAPVREADIMKGVIE